MKKGGEKKREKWFNAYWPIFGKKKKMKSLKIEKKKEKLLV